MQYFARLLLLVYFSILQELKDLVYTLYWDSSTISTQPGNLRLKPPKGFSYQATFDQYGYDQLKQVISKEKEKIRKAEIQASIEDRNRTAREMEYKENFQHAYIPGPAQSESDVFVIKKDETIRNPDTYPNKWRLKQYDQLLPGEIAVSYDKMHLDSPYILTVWWANDEITSAQLDTLCKELAEQSPDKPFPDSPNK